MRMQDITAASTRINANLAERRVRIQKLNGPFHSAIS